MSPVNSRTKGAQWEREVARRFRAVLGLPADDRTVRRAGGGQADGHKVPDVDVPHLWIECKVGPKQDPFTALMQAERDCNDDRACVAVIKHDRRPPFAVMRTSTWVWLCDAGEVGEATDCIAEDVVVRVALDDLLAVYGTRTKLLRGAA